MAGKHTTFEHPKTAAVAASFADKSLSGSISSSGEKSRDQLNAVIGIQNVQKEFDGVQTRPTDFIAEDNEFASFMRFDDGIPDVFDLDTILNEQQELRGKNFGSGDSITRTGSFDELPNFDEVLRGWEDIRSFEEGEIVRTGTLNDAPALFSNSNSKRQETLAQPGLKRQSRGLYLAPYMEENKWSDLHSVDLFTSVRKLEELNKPMNGQSQLCKNLQEVNEARNPLNECDRIQNRSVVPVDDRGPAPDSLEFTSFDMIQVKREELNDEALTKNLCGLGNPNISPQSCSKNLPASAYDKICDEGNAKTKALFEFVQMLERENQILAQFIENAEGKYKIAASINDV